MKFSCVRYSTTALVQNGIKDAAKCLTNTKMTIHNIKVESRGKDDIYSTRLEKLILYRFIISRSNVYNKQGVLNL